VPSEQLNEALSKLGDGNWTVLGTCTNDDIDFDSGLIEMTDAELRWVITVAGYYFENPMGSMPSTIDHEFYDEPYDGTGFYQELYSNKMVSWQAAQHNVIEKLVIIRKV